MDSPGASQQPLLPGDSLASLLVLPGSDEARKMTAGSGLKCLESSKRFYHPMSVRRMLLASQQWSSSIVSLRWRVVTLRERRMRTSSLLYTHMKKLCSSSVSTKTLRTQATGRSITLFQLVPSTPRTDEIESSLWRTPDASVTTGGAANAEDRAAQGHAIGLHDQVNTPSMWPTPRGSDGEKGGPNQRGSKGDLALPSAAVMWPTPTGRDHKDTGDLENVEDNGLLGRVVRPSKESGSLSPQWVEWLQGFPSGWTDLNVSETP
ncbi:hypothetical protein LCGC14_0567520 [marine sediment metagenome]|uniref:Uncharacterized protein n=1 Tax=marine sediment metagenome TaxID=412755 RepID=A0A0F9RQD8_9ZZZZ